MAGQTDYQGIGGGPVLRRVEYMKRIRISLVLVIALAFVLAACGSSKGIEGTRVLTEELDSDGTRLTKEDLGKMGISETYEITGTDVVYRGEMPGLSKPITINFVLEDLGDGRYNFNLEGGLNFASVKLDGDTLTYDAGSGDYGTTMIFKRQ